MKEQSLKQFIWERLKHGEGMLDQEIYAFRRRETDIYTAQTYIAEFRRLQRDEEFWKDRKIARLHNYKRTYIACDERNSCWKISKAFFNKLLPLYKRNMDRPDLINVYDYDLI